MISVYNEKQNCCGCSACYNICPQNAIEMIPDMEGFKYPAIDNQKCIDCGLCQKVCAFGNDKLNTSENNFVSVYAAQYNDDKVLNSSSSGGAFTAISDFVLKLGGVVYGVKFNDNMLAVHSRATTFQERDEFRGSKYLQSDVNTVFPQLLSDLKNNKTVLFTGTPCQCAALKKYLSFKKADTSKLIFCDLVCHGVPSPLIFKEHISFLENKRKTKVVKYYCRSKEKKWGYHMEMAEYDNGTKDYSELVQVYKDFFYSHNILRTSCHNCKYTSFNRVSDITIADYWGIENVTSELDHKKGVSLVLLNTENGKELFRKIKNNFTYIETDKISCLQPQLQKPAEISSCRERFWYDYRKKGYGFLIKKYSNHSLKAKIKKLLIKVLIKLKLLEFMKRIKKLKA